MTVLFPPPSFLPFLLEQKLSEWALAGSYSWGFSTTAIAFDMDVDQAGLKTQLNC